MALAPPQFDNEFRRQLRELFAWRRDVRRFRSDPIDPSLIEEILDVACFAPSVGNSQPWRFVAVDDLARRARVSETFRRCNRAALEDYSGARAALYAQLKLAGLAEAPFHLAVFVDEGTTAGHGLGLEQSPRRFTSLLVTRLLPSCIRPRLIGWASVWVAIRLPTTATDSSR